MEQLEAADRRQLLEIARRSIEAAVCGGMDSRWNRDRRARGRPLVEPPTSEALVKPAAAFVTLREGGDLRGCVGLLRFDVPLWQNVFDAAAAAALDDPRFYAVTPEELPDLDVEISVLEPPVRIDDPARFEAGRHGIVIEKDLRRGLLLPQVAQEMGWGNLEMLEAVCQKAHLPAGSWRDSGVRLSVFEAAHFGEADARPDSEAEEAGSAAASEPRVG